MRLPSGKRLGQSDNEVLLALFYSFLLHAVIIVVVVLLHFVVIPKTALPPAYHVKLVGQPKSLTPSPAPTKKKAPPKVVKSPKKKKKVAAKKKKTVPKKKGMPKLDRKKPKSGKKEKREVVPSKPSAAPSSKVKSAAKAGERVEGVEVSTTSQQFKFPPYLVIIREKIEQNWNPPPGAKNLRVKALFTILRSGRVGNTKLDRSSGNFYFDQAAMRAILSSSPFPPLPEGFFKDFEVFSVDLMENE
jgi:colicin import membrane protein